MFCAMCGRQNKDDAKFCEGCGTPLTAPVVETVTPEAPPVAEGATTVVEEPMTAFAPEAPVVPDGRTHKNPLLLG